MEVLNFIAMIIGYAVISTAGLVFSGLLLIKLFAYIVDK